MTASSGVVLSNLAYLIGAVVLAIIGGLIVWLHHRQPKSVDANVESFSRGLRALAPDESRAGSRRQASEARPAGLRVQPQMSSPVPPEGDTVERDAEQEAPSAPGGRTAGDPGPDTTANAGDADARVVDVAGSETQTQAVAREGPAKKRAGAETG